MKIYKVLCLALSLLAVPAFLFGQCEYSYLFTVPDGSNKEQDLKFAESHFNCWEYQASLAETYHKIGADHYRENNDTAIYYTRKALAIRKLICWPFEEKFGKSNHNLGVFFKENGRYGEAEFFFKNALGIFESGDLDRQCRSLVELGNIYNKFGDYDRSIQTLDLAINRSFLYQDISRLYKGRLEMGLVLFNKGLYTRAIDSLLIVKEYYEGLPPEEDLASCYNNLCVSYLELKKYEQCIDYGHLAIKLAKYFEEEEELGKQLNNVGLAFLKTNRPEKAKAYFDQGLNYGIKTNNRNLIAQSKNNLAEYFLLKRRYEKALLYFHEAASEESGEEVKDVLNNPSMENISRLPSKADMLGYLFDKAKCLLVVYELQGEEKYLDAAIKTLEQCDKVTDLLRRDHSEQSSKIFWREKVLPIYEKAIHACHLAGDMEKAFDFLEKSRAVLLLDAMVQAEVLNDIGDEALKAEEKRIINALYETRESLNNATEKEKSALLPELKKLNDERDQLTKTIAEKYPDYFKLMYETSVVPLETLRQNQLQDGKTALLHYFLGSEKSWLFVYNGSESPVLLELGNALETDSLVSEYLAFFSNSYAIANDPKGYVTAASKLYEYLVGPADLAGIEKLIIIPDGLLGFLPFEALLTKPVDHTNLETLPYLIRDYEIRLSFSATILEQQTSGQVGEGRLMAFAPFAESGSGEFAALPYTAKEISFLRKIISGSFYQSQKARKSLLNQWSDRYSILHLSTHAEANMEAGQPVIAFADTVLTLQELYAMNLPSDLIVLSACETNLGEVKSGEGIFSLSRGFTYAGANSIIASLWKVNAASTGQIFPEFYEYLKDGHSKAEALRIAKLEYLEAPSGNGHIKTPYDWAGFAMMGNNETIKLKPPMGWWKFLIPLAVLAGAFLVWRKNR